MIQKIRAQSIIEYALLAMLVIVGVIVMGPVLIRSINAHFKLWQEPIEDSIHDPMIKRPNSSIPDVGACSCSDFQPGACGGHFQRTSQSCPASQRYYAKHCSPPDCLFGPGFAEECRVDPTCCDQYTLCTRFFNSNDPRASGCCGRIALDTPGNYRTNPTNDPRGIDRYATPVNLNDYGMYCRYGEEVLISVCHDPLNPRPEDIRCMPIPAGSPYPNAGQCDPMCTNLASLVSSACSGTQQNLIQDTPYFIVPASCPALPTNQICRAACNVGLTRVQVSPGVFTCQMPRFTVAPIIDGNPRHTGGIVVTPNPQSMNFRFSHIVNNAVVTPPTTCTGPGGTLCGCADHGTPSTSCGINVN